MRKWNGALFVALVGATLVIAGCDGGGDGACASNPCAHGECVESGDDFSCNCEGGWTGDLCDGQTCGLLSADAPMLVAVAGNAPGGIATYSCLEGYDLEGEAERTCVDGEWDGTEPSCLAGPCAAFPCENEGTCVEDGADGYTCECAAGFEGDDCETNIDDCAPDPCANGGTCIDGADSFICDCSTAAGWQGELCDVAMATCDSEPCDHGSCVEGEAGSGEFTCDCDEGWSGELCDVGAGGCTPNPCENGGTCAETGADTYECSCIDGYTGARCQVAPATTHCILTFELVEGSTDGGLSGCVMEIEDTMMSMGNAQRGVGPGTMIIRVPSDGGTGIGPGTAEILYFHLPQEFVVSPAIGPTITTDVDSFSPTIDGTDNVDAVAAGTLSLGDAPEIAWGACTLPSGYNSSNETYTPDVVPDPATGCLSPYKSLGTVNCDGSATYCNMGDLDAGDNAQDETWVQPLNTFTFDDATMTSFSMPRMLVPNRAPSRTYIRWEGARLPEDILCN